MHSTTFGSRRFTTATLWIACFAVFVSPAFTNAAQDKKSERTVVVVVGAGGEEQYATSFKQWADQWVASAKQPGTNVVRIDPTETDRDKPSCKERLQSTIAESIKRNDSELWIVLIGHGTYNGRAAKFNLAGPDVSAQEMAMWLLEAKMSLAVINCASSSGPFINALSGPDRVIVTATKSGVEQNYCRFGAFMAELIASPTADLDKDGQTSLLEAWLMASRKTAEFYVGESRLATEHALLDDDANMRGSREDSFTGVRPIRDSSKNAKGKTNNSVDGYRAHQFCLIPSDRERNMPPELKKKRDALEMSVTKLRDNRDEMQEAAYYEKLESLLVQLALIYEEAGKNSK